MMDEQRTPQEKSRNHTVAGFTLGEQYGARRLYPYEVTHKQTILPIKRNRSSTLHPLQHRQPSAMLSCRDSFPAVSITPYKLNPSLVTQTMNTVKIEHRHSVG